MKAESTQQHYSLYIKDPVVNDWFQTIPKGKRSEINTAALKMYMEREQGQKPLRTLIEDLMTTVRNASITAGNPEINSELTAVEEDADELLARFDL